MAHFWTEGEITSTPKLSCNDRLAPAGLVPRDWAVHRGDVAQPLVPPIIPHFGGTGFAFSGDGSRKAPGVHHAPLQAPWVFWETGWGPAEVRADEEGCGAWWTPPMPGAARWIAACR